jgi:hypothetical protein
MGDESTGDLILIYAFRLEDELIRQMQEVSLDPSSHGLAPDPLIGSNEWWEEIESGQRPTRWIDGTIADVYWGSMADYPEFTIRSPDGPTSTWTRQGAVRRYVEGLSVRLAYVEHPWKDTQNATLLGFGEATEIVLQIWIENSPRRSSGIAPGPGGVGYKLTREQQGDVVHYLEFGSREAAERVAHDFEKRGARVRTYAGGISESWFVEVWDRGLSSVDERRSELRAISEALGGGYDGGEIVEGESWGSHEAERRRT